MLLAINKQLDAHGYLADGPVGPFVDRLVGWAKDASRPAVSVLLAVGLGAVGAVAAWVTSGLARFRLAVAAVVVLALAGALRAAAIVGLGPALARLDHDAALPVELAGATLLLLASVRQAWLNRRRRVAA